MQTIVNGCMMIVNIIIISSISPNNLMLSVFNSTFIHMLGNPDILIKNVNMIPLFLKRIVTNHNHLQTLNDYELSIVFHKNAQRPLNDMQHHDIECVG